MVNISLTRALLNGLRKRCPRCGLGHLFKSWFILNEQCSFCDCPFQDREDDTYFFMYMSTGFITGVFIIGMFFVIPKDLQHGKIILLVLSLVLFIATSSFRKGLAIAIDFYIDSQCEHPKHLKKNKLN